MNLLKEATEAARHCFDYQKKAALVHYTSELRDVFGRFTISCSREDMSDLVGAWTRVLLALNNLPPWPGAGPEGGKQPKPVKEEVTNVA